MSTDSKSTSPTKGDHPVIPLRDWEHFIEDANILSADVIDMNHKPSDQVLCNSVKKKLSSLRGTLDEMIDKVSEKITYKFLK